MAPDILSVILRGLSFVAMAQGAGAALFLLLFESALDGSRPQILRTARRALACGLILLPAQVLLEAARMSGNLSGILDWNLQVFALSTITAKVAAIRMLGLAILAVALRGRGALQAYATAAGLVLTCASFALMGHTATDPARWLLGPAVCFHVAIVVFWFGSLQPLIQVARRETAASAAQIVARFSQLAGVAVPLVLLAGLVIAVRLLPDWQAVTEPYGLALLTKVLAFGALMGLAALNKCRFGPALASGDATAVRHFRVAVILEWLILAAVLLATAVFTAFLSPHRG